LKRAFPQKIKSVSLPIATSEASSEGMPLESESLRPSSASANTPRIADAPRQTAQETNRRVRTSAAMIGLAISMGASSLLLPKQGEKAMASEPVASDPQVTTATGSSTSEVALSSSPEVEPSVSIQSGALGLTTLSGTSVIGGQQVVQVGQKIDLIAPETGINPVDVAKTSPIVAARLKAAGIGKQESQGELAPSAITLAENADDLLKAEQNQSLDRLKQKREELKESLTQLRLENQATTEPNEASRVLNFVTPQQIANSYEGIAYYPLVEAVPTENANPAEAAPTETAAHRLSIPQSNPLELEEVPAAAQPSFNPEIPATSALLSPSSEAINPSWQSSVVTASSTKPSLSNAFGAQGRVYQVKPGDTVESIARRHGLTRSELVDANQLSNPNDLSVSQVLRIPQVEFNPTAPQIVMLQPETQPELLEAVVEDSSRLSVADEPESLNPLPIQQLAQPESVEAATVMPQVMPSPSAESLNIEIQNLREKYQAPESQATAQPVPLMAMEVASASEPQVGTLPRAVEYRVNRGDTLDAIARRYGISRSELIRANRISNPNLIEVNQVLQIPNTNVSSSTVMTIPSLNFNRAEEVAAAEPVVVFNSASSNSQRPFEASPVRTVASTPRSESAIASVGEGNAPVSYVDGLMNEINQMREKYQGPATQQPNQASTPAPSVVAPGPGAASLSTNQPTNPEFSPNRYTDALQADVQRLQGNPQSQSPQQPVATALAPTREAARANSQQVAVAPNRPEAYNPSLQIPYGRVVSPDLPPLAPAERYLPEGAPTFDGYVWPAKGVFTSGYGWRWGRMHRGIDIAGPVGTPIVAAAPGVVDFAGWNSGGYGNLVDIRHPDGSLTRYAHNNRLMVRTGQRVEQGQQIAEMGSTGYSTGPHLHFEVHPSGQGAVNPMAFLPR